MPSLREEAEAEAEAEGDGERAENLFATREASARDLITNLLASCLKAKSSWTPAYVQAMS